MLITRAPNQTHTFNGRLRVLNPFYKFIGRSRYKLSQV